jgi:carboxyl-terminal processing protease
MIQEARAYLTEALDYIQQHSVMKERVDWAALRHDAFSLAAHAQTTAETYSAIKLAVERLGDHHSFFLDPVAWKLRQEGKVNNVGVLAVHPVGTIGRVFPGSAAEQAGVLVGDRIETINDKSPASVGVAQFRAELQESSVRLTLARAGHPLPIILALQAIPYSPNLKPEGRRLDGDLGYLDLPGLIGGGPMQHQYAPIAHQAIREVDQRVTYGWVVDVRRNPGGNVWPMLAGVGPVLGEGEVNSSVSAEGEKIATVYRNGQALYGSWVTAQVDEPYRLKRPAPPVAVLTSQLTRSSGEHVVLAFRGRPRTRSFGEPSAGDPTANAGKVFSDGAALFLTVAFGTDRTGRSYDGPLEPDHPLKIDWMLLGTGQDPVLQAALKWLRYFAGSDQGVDF